MTRGTKENRSVKFKYKTSFFPTFTGFSKPEHFTGAFTNEKLLNVSGNDKFDMKRTFIDGSFSNRIRQPILYTFAFVTRPC